MIMIEILNNKLPGEINISIRALQKEFENYEGLQEVNYPWPWLHKFPIQRAKQYYIFTVLYIGSEFIKT